MRTKVKRSASYEDYRRIMKRKQWGFCEAIWDVVSSGSPNGYYTFCQNPGGRLVRGGELGHIFDTRLCDSCLERRYNKYLYM